MDEMTVGIIIFQNLTQLDATGPQEVFAATPGMRVLTIAKTLDPITAKSGLRLLPDVTLAACPALDIVCVPGGPGANDAAEDPEILEFLNARAENLKFITSVCTGALVLGAAGLLRGRRATSHWSARDLLSGFGAIPTPARVVRDGRVVTGGGVTAGIDFALTLIAEIRGVAAAQAVQLGLEYAPAPPFAAGSPESAPATILAEAKARGAGLRAAREALVARARKSL